MIQQLGVPCLSADGGGGSTVHGPSSTEGCIVIGFVGFIGFLFCLLKRLAGYASGRSVAKSTARSRLIAMATAACLLKGSAAQEGGPPASCPTAEEALLAFKASSSDPGCPFEAYRCPPEVANGLMANWIAGTDPCTWTGVRCSSLPECNTPCEWRENGRPQWVCDNYAERPGYLSRYDNGKRFVPFDDEQYCERCNEDTNGGVISSIDLSGQCLDLLRFHEGGTCPCEEEMNCNCAIVGMNQWPGISGDVSLLAHISPRLRTRGVVWGDLSTTCAGGADMRVVQIYGPPGTQYGYQSLYTPGGGPCADWDGVRLCYSPDATIIPDGTYNVARKLPGATLPFRIYSGMCSSYLTDLQQNLEQIRADLPPGCDRPPPTSDSDFYYRDIKYKYYMACGAILEKAELITAAIARCTLAPNPELRVGNTYCACCDGPGTIAGGAPKCCLTEDGVCCADGEAGSPGRGEPGYGNQIAQDFSSWLSDEQCQSTTDPTQMRRCAQALVTPGVCGPCIDSENCKAGVCVPGEIGPGCSQCDLRRAYTKNTERKGDETGVYSFGSGYYEFGSHCLPCPAPNGQRWKIALFTTFVVGALALFVIWKVTLVRVVENYNELDGIREDVENVIIAASRMAALGGFLGIAVPHLQVLGLLTMLPLHWPEFVLKTFGWFRSIFFFDIGAIFISVKKCDYYGQSFSDNEDNMDAVTELATHMSFWFVLIMLASTACCFRGCCCCQVRESRRQTSFHLRNNVDVIFVFSATMLAHRAATLHVQTIGEGTWLYQTISCVVYFVMLPIVLIRPLVVAKRAETIDNPEVLQAHGWLLLKYRAGARVFVFFFLMSIAPLKFNHAQGLITAILAVAGNMYFAGAWYTEFVFVYHRVFMTFVVALFNDAAWSVARLMIMMVITAAVVAFIVVAKPYKGTDDTTQEELPDNHRMHVAALTAQLVAFGLGLISLAVGPEDSDGRSVADAVISLLISLVVIVPMVYTRVRPRKQSTADDGDRIENPMETETE